MDARLIRREYGDFAGVDFKNSENLVSLNRSPDALNVYRDYLSDGVCVQTRPGFRFIGRIGADRVNGLYVYNKTSAVVHCGNRLFLWSNFPDTPVVKVLCNYMNDGRTSFFMLNNKLYINDGVNYLVYDGVLKKVSEVAFVPTTSIGRLPSGGGVEFQDVNVLTGDRKNQFCADGTSKEYFLDREDVDSVKGVWVNDVKLVSNTDYSVDLVLGKVVFKSAPVKPSVDGQDNVVVLFSVNVDGYMTRISKCGISLSFDNRAFFSGNPDFPNAVFHSELNNPAYVSDLSYYQDGSSDNGVRDMTVGNNVLWVFKESSQDRATVFYHVPVSDGVLGRIYPSKQGNVSTGCCSKCINFNDDIVFLSRNGLEGITGDISSEQLLSHRSSLVDNRLISLNNYCDAQMVEWRGYLLVLVDDYVFLADSRQKFEGVNGVEYEWYFWNIGSVMPSVLKEYNGDVFVGGKDGSVYILEGTNDAGQIIDSYWSTPLDCFGYSNLLKSTNKRGGVAKIKIIPNGVVKIAERTNCKKDRFIGRKSLSGFCYDSFDYSNFSYISLNDSYVVYKIKEKKFLELSMKFYSDELDKPFGLYSATLEAFVGGYVKR